MEFPDPFNTSVKQYDAWFDAHPYAYEAELAAIRELMPPSGLGVEIGVGTGRFAAPLGVRWGVDPSAAMLEVARERGIESLQGRAEDLPLVDEAVDYALMVTTLCFLEDVERAFREVYRILRSPGCFILAFIDADSPLGKRYLTRKAGSLFYRKARFYSTKNVVRALRKAGFAGFEMRQTIFEDPDSMTEPDAALGGFGRGGFVVIRGEKKKETAR